MTLCSKKQPSSADSILEMCDSEKSLFFNSSEATTTSSNTTNDLDLSSTSSFKWATCARLQNRSEWLEIERILYGEQELPEDAKTKQEFKEWMTAFPHLRVIGKKINLNPDLLDKDPKQKTEYVDEYFAIDPPIEKIENDTFSFSLDEELHEKLMLRKSRYNNSNLKNNDVEKYLRITSGPIIRNQHHFQQQNKKAIDRSYTFKPHSNFIGNNQKLNQIQENKRYDHPTELRNSTLKVQGITKISYSATSRMPPILNIKFLKETELPQSGKPSVKSATTKFSSTNHYDEIDEKRSRKCINTLGLLHPATLISSKSATFSSKFNKLNSKNQNIIQLPALHRNLDFNSEIVGRSISALCKK